MKRFAYFFTRFIHEKRPQIINIFHKKISVENTIFAFGKSSNDDVLTEKVSPIFFDQSIDFLSTAVQLLKCETFVLKEQI